MEFLLPFPEIRRYTMYTIQLADVAKKFLKSLSKKMNDLVREKIKRLAEDPYAKNNNVKKLKKSDRYRLRVGDIRVIYLILNDVLVIKVIDIAFKKEDTYKG